MPEGLVQLACGDSAPGLVEEGLNLLLTLATGVEIRLDLGAQPAELLAGGDFVGSGLDRLPRIIEPSLAQMSLDRLRRRGNGLLMLLPRFFLSQLPPRGSQLAGRFLIRQARNPRSPYP